MDELSNMTSIIKEQKILLEKLEKQHSNLLKNDVSVENKRLKVEYKNLDEKYIGLKNEMENLISENKELKEALFGFAYNEKTGIINQYQKKSQAYFEDAKNNQINRISTIESTAQKRLAAMKMSLEQYNTDTAKYMNSQIDALSVAISQNIVQSKNSIAVNFAKMKQETVDEFAKLKDEPLTDEQIKSAAKSNNLEKLVGLNILNKVGIFLIVVGVFAASQYAYYRLSDGFKGILIFAIGAVMMAVGEFMDRKKTGVFSLGLVAGGVSILYLGVGVSYFLLKIFGMYTALLSCVLITIFAFFLSIRHNSKVIAAFALIGAYMPLVSIMDNRTLLMGSMIYFLILHIFVLLVATRKKWHIISLMGLSFNAFSAPLIAFKIAEYSIMPGQPLIAVETFLFLFAAFAIYTVVPIISTKRDKSRFNIVDVISLSINTVVSGFVIFTFMWRIEYFRFAGILALIFSVIYFISAKYVKRVFQNEKRIEMLFMLTCLTFIFLAVPMQFGVKWYSLGWLIEGVLFAIYGIIKDDKLFKRAGYVIGAVCLFSFIMIDIVFDDMVTFKYSVITLGGIAILAALLSKKQLLSRFERIFEYCTVINLWMYMEYILFWEMRWKISGTVIKKSYLVMSLAIIITFIYAFILPFIRDLQGRYIKKIANVLLGIGIMLCLFINSFLSPFVGESVGEYLIGTLPIILLGVLSTFALFILCKGFVLSGKINHNIVLLVLSGYFLIILTQDLIVHYNVLFTSVVFSAIYAVMSIVWIVVGFNRQISFLRKFGLGLAIMSVVKLFVLDLYTLTEGYRIVSYFALGITLVAISYVYQRFSKKLELQTSVVTKNKTEEIE